MGVPPNHPFQDGIFCVTSIYKTSILIHFGDPPFFPGVVNCGDATSTAIHRESQFFEALLTCAHCSFVAFGVSGSGPRFKILRFSYVHG